MQGLRILASAKEILLDTDLALDLPKVRGDIGRISQLVNNLVTNAIKFTPTGGMVKTITQAAIRDGVPGVEIRVEDTGVGIKSSERVRIFQRFHRGRAKGTDGERGAGLGLSICKEIMQLHGGALEVASGNPRGTIMIAWFPINGPTIDADLTGSVCRTEGSQASLMN